MILQGREVIEILPLWELYTTYRIHHRLEVFAQKGRQCVACERIGTLLLSTREKNGSEHIDLYTDDFVLMTVDHDIPKSLGGADTLENKQPMCEPCNGNKGSKPLTLEQMRQNSGPLIMRDGPELIRQFIDNEDIFDKDLSFVVDLMPESIYNV